MAGMMQYMYATMTDDEIRSWLTPAEIWLLIRFAARQRGLIKQVPDRRDCWASGVGGYRIIAVFKH